MKRIPISVIEKIGFGLAVLLLALPPIHAQGPRDPGRGEFPDRGASPRAPGERGPGGRGAPPLPGSELAGSREERGPSSVDRFLHGSIRHLDMDLFAPPLPPLREFGPRQRIIVHRDVDVEVNRPRFWHGFVFGERRSDLRAGYLQILVNNVPYYYDEGIYYRKVDDGYQEVYPPAGATIPEAPDGAIEVQAEDRTYYYAGGAFYVRQGIEFVVAAAPMGVIVPELPPDAARVALNFGVAYRFNAVYYRPVFVNGVTQYRTFIPDPHPAQAGSKGAPPASLEYPRVELGKEADTAKPRIRMFQNVKTHSLSL